MTVFAGAKLTTRILEPTLMAVCYSDAKTFAGGCFGHYQGTTKCLLTAPSEKSPHVSMIRYVRGAFSVEVHEIFCLKENYVIHVCNANLCPGYT